LIVETAQTPMLKLTHKIEHGRDAIETTYRWLCDRTMRDPIVDTPTAVVDEKPRSVAAKTFRG
jgi:hypothetical protein